MFEHPADIELLAYMDNELSEPLTADVGQHLEHCRDCATRYRSLRQISSETAEIWHAAPMAPAPEGRERLTECMRTDVERRWARRAPLVLALTAGLLFVTFRHESSIVGRSFVTERGALPVSLFTPGAATSVSTAIVCSEVRRVPPNVPQAIRAQVLRDYRMEHVPPNEYELDYLITPELGGLTDRRNLWPEPYGLRSWNAHAKDALEHLLPRLVCRGEIDLATAQRAISENWIGAYKKYLASDRPIALHARSLLPAQPTRHW